MPSLLDILALVAPQTALKRAIALRQLDQLRSYEGAKTGRRGASFGNRNLSANAAIGTSLARLRDRSSEMVRDSSIGSRTIDVLTAHLVGTGIQTVWNTGSDAADRRVKALWDKFIHTSDVEGVLDYAGQQMLLVRAMLERGEGILRFIPRRLTDGLAVPLQMQVLESDMIDDARDRSQSLSQAPGARLGVELGQWNARQGLWLHGAHPSEMQASVQLRSSLVPQADVCHLYRPLRPGQVRGVPILAPVLLQSRDYADLMDAVIIKARMEACYGLIVQQADSARTLAASDKDAENRRIEDLRPGMVAYTQPGETVTAFNPSGQSQVEQLAILTLMSVAVGGMVTYDQLTGDLRQANYSSLRAGKIEFRRLVEQIQWLNIVPMVLSRVRNRFLDVAILSGRLPARRDGYNSDYVMPAIEPIDPKKDLEADILAVRSGRMSPQEFISGWGRDWREVLNDTETFLKSIDAKGIVLDIDPRKVSQAGLQQGQGPADPQSQN